MFFELFKVKKMKIFLKILTDEDPFDDQNVLNKILPNNKPSS